MNTVLRRAISAIMILPLASALGNCHKNGNPAPDALFDSVPVSKPVVPLIREGSGIADSKANPGFLWVEEDSGNPPQIYLVGHNGAVSRKIYIKGAVNRDWEDMALSGNDLYIGDIGDNNQSYADYTIYHFPEPSSGTDTITNAQAIKFKYPDGSHDAEAFLVDPDTKDIYIITKRDNPSRIYKLTAPYTAVAITQQTGTLSFSGVTSAAITPDGREIIVKTYTGIYYYKRAKDQTITQALQNSAVQLPYMLEPQGEAVTFATDHSGYYTLSEIGFANFVNLNFYKRR